MQELTDEQQCELDEMKALFDDALKDDIALRKDEMTETVSELRDEMKDDIKDCAESPERN